MEVLLLGIGVIATALVLMGLLGDAIDDRGARASDPPTVRFKPMARRRR